MVLVQANEDAIIQIIMNLLFNAADVTEEQGSIAITLSEGSNHFAELRVIDGGPGISEDMRRHIFDPFFTSKRESEGVGLGLSVSHSLARSFQGELILESSDAKGTAFLLRVPLARTKTDG
jgi:signal transduction histidine kinase